jgi:hypothetical protein
MAGEPAPRDADIEKVSAGLADGLKTLKSMIANYRSLLSADESQEPLGKAEGDEPENGPLKGNED